MLVTFTTTAGPGFDSHRLLTNSKTNWQACHGGFGLGILLSHFVCSPRRWGRGGGQCTRLLCSSIIRDIKLPTTKTFSDLLFRNVKQYKMAGVGPFQENLKTLGLTLAWTWLLLDAVVRLHVVGWGEGPWALVTPVKASRAGVGLNKKHFQLPIDT